MTAVAGIFFADDNIVFGGADLHRSKDWPGYRFSNIYIARERIGRKASDKSPHAGVGRALLGIKQYYEDEGRDFSEIKAISTASLGPHVAKIVGQEGHGIHLSGLRVKEWDNFDIVASVQSWRSEIMQGTKTPRLHEIPVHAYIDSEAMALGEYYRMIKTGEISTHSSGFPQDTLVLLLADTGINGAVIKRNSVFRGETHNELGHMRVNLHRDDILRCDGSPIPKDVKRGRRLSYLASLEALERRWGLSAKEYVKGKLKNGEKLDGDFIKYLGYYFGQAIANIALFYSPTKVKLVGRVFDHPDILKRIRHYYRKSAKWEGRNILYPGYPAQQDSDSFIQIQHHRDIGILGCLCGAAKACINDSTGVIHAR